MLRDLYSKEWEWLGYFTHIHHAKKVPIERSNDIRDRIRCINRYKEYKEQALRIALIRRVPDSLLPKSALKLQKAQKDLEKVDKLLKNARTAYINAPDENDEKEKKAFKAAEKAFDAADAKVSHLDRRVGKISRNTWIRIHKKACHPNCPWEPIRHNIFSQGYSTRVLKNKKK